jgi:hypothetical protein
VAKTAPMRQMEVGRELRARVKTVLDAAGVPPAGPDTIVITAPAGQGEAGALSAPGADMLTVTEQDAAQEDDPQEDDPQEEGAKRGTP